ncbi:MAG: hypothetical protein CSA65_02580 [Proteobacteria bacterium]|nr:MAG: hypothetical protein CSB49_04115 [Pseudomonadota bacterium]PIE19386.1 MAG: hypothetical protein CSA65_02580 [Pseudomonadota bacterium]
MFIRCDLFVAISLLAAGCAVDGGVVTGRGLAISEQEQGVEDIDGSSGAWRARRAKHPVLGSHVLAFLDRRAALSPEDLSRWADRREFLRRSDGRLQVEAPLRVGFSAADLDVAALEAAGASLLTGGVTIVDLAVPIDHGVAGLEAVMRAAPALRALDTPLLPTQEVGAAETQGVKKTLADTFHAIGTKGGTVEVAVFDVGWTKWSPSKASGDLPSVSADPSPEDGGTHGTNCAQVVADMAPDAVIRAVDASTLAKEEAFINNTLASTSVQVITRSLSGTHGYYSDGRGPYCDNATKAKGMGVVTINSAGNYADGRFWRGTFKDSDGDDWHEWSGSDEVQTMTVTNSSRIKVNLDWNDYPTSNVDFDLFLAFKKSDGTWENVETSERTQSGSQSPREWIVLNNPTAGTYGLSVKRKSGSGSISIRVFAYAGPKLQHHQAKGSLNAPATCADVISVAAIPQAQYTVGPQIAYSSQGPTWDGRIKPDVAAPTLVKTSIKTSFSGTSAAAPHVAGALALYIDAMNTNANAAAAALLADVAPMGSNSPNTTYGRGRIALDLKRAGCVCNPGDQQSCQTSCGGNGSRSCLASGCSWSSCVPPKETCNGKDDDCDGEADNGFACAIGETRVCISSCNTAGTQTCSASCVWSSCVPPRETCNGKDDDCDKEIDEDNVCGPPGRDLGPAPSDSGAGPRDGARPRDGGGGRLDRGAGPSGVLHLEGGCATGRGGAGSPLLLLLLTVALLARRFRFRRSAPGEPPSDAGSPDMRAALHIPPVVGHSTGGRFLGLRTFAAPPGRSGKGVSLEPRALHSRR